MFYHFCFLLVLVAASNGQRYPSYVAPTARPIVNVSPNNYRGPSNNPVSPVPRVNGNPITTSDDAAYRVPDNNNGGFISVNNKPLNSNSIDSGFGPTGPAYGSTPHPVLPNSDPNDTAFGREPYGSGDDDIVYPSPIIGPIDPAFGRDDSNFTTTPNHIDITTNDYYSSSEPNRINSTTESNDSFVTDNPDIIYPGPNNTGILPNRDPVCRRRFGFYRVDSSCDSYLECRNYQVFRMMCPDGMHFNPNAFWPEYPCGYPGDVPCVGRGVIQPPKPTNECPHQFGFFPITDESLSPPERCSRYIMCSAGVANIMDCPFGLAFNAATGRCDWPERVPGCQEFLGFHCPAPHLGEEEKIMNFKYSEHNCYYFWSCQQGRGRVLSCDYGLAFDSITGRCVDEDLINCGDENVSLGPEEDSSSSSHVYLM